MFLFFSVTLMHRLADETHAESDLWRGTLGVHGLDERNNTGEEFCATNQLTIMNSWFQKKEIHLGMCLLQRNII